MFIVALLTVAPNWKNQSCKTSYSRSYLGILVSNKMELTTVHIQKNLYDSLENYAE